MNQPIYRYTPDIQGYQDAVWDFLLEHSDVTESGKLFIKFHTDDRRNFENRIFARWKYNYHREDVEAKAAKLEIAKITHAITKREKKEKYKADKKARIATLNEPKPFVIDEENVIGVFARLRKLINK